MSCSGPFRLLGAVIRTSSLSQFQLPKCHYAKKASGGVSMVGASLAKKRPGKLGAVVKKVTVPVETDPHKLTKFVCGSNIYLTGQDVELKPDSEYPEWLWSIRLGPPPPLESMDPDSREYWKRVRKLAMRKNNQLAKLKPF